MELIGTTAHPPVIRQFAAVWGFIRRWPVIPAAVIVVLIILGVFGPQIADCASRCGAVRRPQQAYTAGRIRALPGRKVQGRKLDESIGHRPCWARCA